MEICECQNDPVNSPCSDFEAMTQMCACADIGLNGASPG